MQLCDPPVFQPASLLPPIRPLCTPRASHQKADGPVPSRDSLCEMRCNISSCAYDRGDCGVGLSLSLVLGASEGNVYKLIGVGVAIGGGLGMLLLRFVLHKIRKDEEKRRGYSLSEMKGMDMYDAEDLG